MNAPEDILARLTPERVANELEGIARQIRNGQDPHWSDTEFRDMHTRVDVLHLRQIADWLEKRMEGKQ